MGKLLKVSDVAKMLNIQPASVYARIKKGKLKAVPIGDHSIRIDSDELTMIMGSSLAYGQLMHDVTTGLGQLERKDAEKIIKDYQRLNK